MAKLAQSNKNSTSCMFDANNIFATSCVISGLNASNYSSGTACSRLSVVEDEQK